MQFRGEITTTLCLPDGTILDRETKKNTILNAGLLDVLGLLTGTSSNPYRYVQIGTGGENQNVALTDAETGQPVLDPQGHQVYGDVLKTVADNETALYTYYAETNNILQDLLNGRYTISCSFQVPIDTAVNEAGICNGSHAGSPVMVAKQVFSNTVKRWTARQTETQSIVDTDYIILWIAWAIFFGRDPDYEILYDIDTGEIFNPVQFRQKV